MRVTATLEERVVTLAPEEAAAHVGLRPTTLANWRWRGQGPRYVKVGGRVRYRLTDLALWLDEQARTSTSDPGPNDRDDGR